MRSLFFSLSLSLSLSVSRSSSLCLYLSFVLSVPLSLSRLLCAGCIHARQRSNFLFLLAREELHHAASGLPEPDIV